MLRRLWADPVWSKVIAGIILALGAALGTYLLDWWTKIGYGLKKAYEFAETATSVPNWLLGLLIILSLPAVLIAGLALWMKLFPPKETGPDWRSYTSDKFFGLLWRWRYLSDGQIHEVSTYCPECDFQIFPENASAYHAIDRIHFQCESCGTQLGDFDESALSLENKVMRFVQQKLRNRTWVASDNS